MELFSYTSTSEIPISFHLMPFDSADLDLFVVFGSSEVINILKWYFINAKYSLHSETNPFHEVWLGTARKE